MNRSKVLWALAVLNAALLVGLSWKLGGENQARANMNIAGDYIMVPARIPGATSGVVYVIDTRAKMLVPVALDVNAGKFNVGDRIDLNNIITNGQGALNGGGRRPPLRRP